MKISFVNLSYNVFYFGVGIFFGSALLERDILLTLGAFVIFLVILINDRRIYK